jgi:tRNA threonylcarbamoyl adenosine modification protein YjeE
MKRTFKTEPELAAFAAGFGRSLRAGDVVGFSGPLGSGKTTFIRAVVQARTGEEATSPTFTFWHRYPGDPPIDHLDLYRVEDPSEIAELGLEEAFDGTSIALVEWWEHAPSLLPARRFVVTLAGAGSSPRDLELEEPA